MTIADLTPVLIVAILVYHWTWGRKRPGLCLWLCGFPCVTCATAWFETEHRAVFMAIATLALGCLLSLRRTKVPAKAKQRR